jgi:hypothetical protein
MHEEADSQAINKCTNKASKDTAMIASKVRKCVGKGKGKLDELKICLNPNCKRTGHLMKDCFRPGGGKEGQGWNKKNGKTMTANTALTKDDEDIALIATVSHSNSEEAALTTSDSDSAIIVECGATCHFSSDRKKFIKFMEIPPQLKKFTNGRSLQAMGRRNMQILLPMGGSTKPTGVILTNMYYAPKMAYTLISVSQMDQCGLSVHIGGNLCTIHTPKPEGHTIGRVPHISRLY